MCRYGWHRRARVVLYCVFETIFGVDAFQPTFGSHIQTPPNNRRPITLLKPRSASSSQSRGNETIVDEDDDGLGLYSINSLISR
jgi:hypothetical protein